MTEPTIIVRRDREAMFEKRHPWVFSGAIHMVNGDPADGDLVALRTDGGSFLARGYWNHQSQISVHVLSWDDEQRIDDDFWRARLERAIDGRRREGGLPNACRLINAENDGLPGLIVDRYADWLVIQALTMGIDRRKQMIAKLLMDLLGPAGIYERSDVDVRSKEGLPANTGLLAGKKPPALVEIDENGRHFLVDVFNGHKTGFYLDQRENRAALSNWLRFDPAAPDRVVLNCFSYTGGFAVYALDSMAHRVINVDSSAEALALAKRNVALNGFPAPDGDFVVADVFDKLRQYRADGERFDIIVLDPPKFAQNQRQIESACRGYKDINLLAFQLIKPGGLLLTFSCSGLVDADLFQKVVFGALADSKREAQIIARLFAGPDHPVALTFPEGAYLKGLMCRVW
ncbi:MAG TPA: class I SAM-dependent rRNA methyltransferase [Aggregatilineales bacterium]|nr:class I SAM-dependent rRNA methyltransferase [Aggregatilineales bacterium]